MFNLEHVGQYIVIFGVVFVVSYLATTSKQSFEMNDDYEMIRKYLLNDSPLYGYNRPKLWIHSKYEQNSRKWKDFYSRNTTDLNQPYIHLTIKTIIDHCGDNFNVCLIDDESFSKLIPSWDIDLTTVAEPMRNHLRDLGMMQLLYFYGGMVVPNSLVCLKNLKELYLEGISGNKPFVVEAINRTTNVARQKQKLLFVPDLYICGAEKNDPVILQLVEFLKHKNRNPHFEADTDFTGAVSQWCLDKIQQQKMRLIGGETVGIKTVDRKTVLLENLMEEDFLKFHPTLVGIYIPREEILNRPKFQWFASLCGEQVLKTNAIISKYLMAAIADTTGTYAKKEESHSAISI